MTIIGDLTANPYNLNWKEDIFYNLFSVIEKPEGRSSPTEIHAGEKFGVSTYTTNYDLGRGGGLTWTNLGL